MTGSPVPGLRVELIRTGDLYTRLRPGARGIVASVDDLGTVHVRWDDGSALGLISEQDAWRDLPSPSDDRSTR